MHELASKETVKQLHGQRAYFPSWNSSHCHETQAHPHRLRTFSLHSQGRWSTGRSRWSYPSRESSRCSVGLPDLKVTKEKSELWRKRRRSFLSRLWKWDVKIRENVDVLSSALPNLGRANRRIISNSQTFTSPFPSLVPQSANSRHDVSVTFPFFLPLTSSKCIPPRGLLACLDTLLSLRASDNSNGGTAKLKCRGCLNSRLQAAGFMLTKSLSISLVQCSS